ncbi:unnamed protein product, partial [Gordionus sp. m RMFG-2023]
RLYVSPELLKDNWEPGQGTQKGDVYSFAIILQEILLRCKPYVTPKTLNIKTDELDHKEIIQRVKGNYKPPFRPSLCEEILNEIPTDWIQLIKSCWEENPDFRPNFQLINMSLKKMNK